MRQAPELKRVRIDERLIAYAILLITVIVMVVTVGHSLNNSGYLSAWDAGGHLLKAHYFAHELLPHGNLSGWYPLWHGGFDLFQFYPPLLYYLLGPLTLIFQPELALRLMTASLWIALVPATYYFLRSFRLSRIIAAVGASTLLALNASFGIGLGALYGVGLLPNGLGAVLAIWLLGRMKRDLSDPARNKYQFVLTGLVMGALLLAHTFSAYWVLLASVVLLATQAVGGGEPLQRCLKRYGFIVVVGLLVSAYWWVPLTLNLEHMGPTGSIQQPARGDILSGLLLARDSGGVIITLLAGGGLAYLAWLKRWRTFAFFVGLGLLTLLLSLNTINNVLPFHSIIASSQYIRFHAYFSWLMLAVAAFGVAGVWQLLKLIKLPYVPITVFISGLALLFGLVVWPSLNEKKGFINVVDNAPTRELDQLAGFLEANLKPGDFILSEFNWDSRFYFGTPHFINQHLPLHVPNAWDLDGNFPEGTRAAAKPVLIASVMDQTGYVRTEQRYLQSRGIRYLITTHPTTREQLQRESWLEEVWAGKALAVFRLTNFEQTFGLPPAVGPQVATVTYDQPGDYHISFRQPVAIASQTSTALSYHPWLHAYLNGKQVPTRADSEYRLVLAGEGSNVTSLQIRYEPPLATKLASIVSILALLAIAVLLIKPEWLEALVERAKTTRRPRRSAGPGRRSRRKPN